MGLNAIIKQPAAGDGIMELSTIPVPQEQSKNIHG